MIKQKAFIPRIVTELRKGCFFLLTIGSKHPHLSLWDPKLLSSSSSCESLESKLKYLKTNFDLNKAKLNSTKDGITQTKTRTDEAQSGIATCSKDIQTSADQSSTLNYSRHRFNVKIFRLQSIARNKHPISRTQSTWSNSTTTSQAFSNTMVAINFEMMALKQSRKAPLEWHLTTQVRRLASDRHWASPRIGDVKLITLYISQNVLIFHFAKWGFNKPEISRKPTLSLPANMALSFSSHTIIFLLSGSCTYKNVLNKIFRIVTQCTWCKSNAVSNGYFTFIKDEWKICTCTKWSYIK